MSLGIGWVHVRYPVFETVKLPFGTVQHHGRYKRK